MRTGTSQRPAELNKLARGTSFVLTIYTNSFPQGHTGLQNNGNPLASAPFLLDKEDASPIYSLMHQSFSDNRQKSHIAETAAVPTLTAPGTDETDATPTPPPRPRRLWALRPRSGRCPTHMAKGDSHTTRFRYRIHSSPNPSRTRIHQNKWQ